MRRCNCRCVLGCTSWCAIEVDQVWPVCSINGVNRVIDCCVHDREASGWMDGRRLSARCANDGEKCSIPLDDWVHSLSRRAASSLRRSTIRAANWSQKSRTKKCESNQGL